MRRERLRDSVTLLSRWNVAIWLWLWSLSIGGVLFAGGLYGSLGDDHSNHLGLYTLLGLSCLVSSMLAALLIVKNAKSSPGRRAIGFLAGGVTAITVLFIIIGF